MSSPGRGTASSVPALAIRSRPVYKSAAALRKVATKKTDDGFKVHSFQTLLGDLATVAKNRIQPKDKKISAFDMFTTPTGLQQRAFDLLGVTL